MRTEPTEKPKRILTSIAERERGLDFITRCDSHGTHGWNVRPPGRKRDKYFADAKHGGRAKALDMAIAWRDAEGPVVSRRKGTCIYPLPYDGEVAGYYVRLVRKGHVFQAYHSIKRYGSVEAAKAAAEAFRDSTLAKFAKISK